jgi:acyl carrier protein
MTQPITLELVQHVIKEQSLFDAASTTTLADLPLNSLDYIEIVMVLEDTLGVEILDEKLVDLKNDHTVADFTEALNNAIRQMSYSLKDIAADLLAGKLQLSTDELATERLKVCEQCPSFQKALRQCKLCGCLMDAKARLLRAECPAGKW